MAVVLVPLPDTDFDVTEVAVPWRLLTRAGHRVVFATERGGAPPRADPLLLSGVIFGQLGAEPEPKAFYRELVVAPEFVSPVAWTDLDPSAYDGIMLPGGHAPGMRQYLGSTLLQEKVAAYFALGRPVGAICHGVLLAARSKNPKTQQSVLADLRTTCLPKYMEQIAFYLTAWKLSTYYRTYPMYVEDEVRMVLRDPAGQFVRGPLSLVKRGTLVDDRAAFVVEDDFYVSARWPGDAYLFANRFMARLRR
jgi:putative intracellular protease/amidase